MADEIEYNMFLVNAPAGSGKTTWIRKQVENHIIKNENDNVLCITYTNRAAEELGRDIDSNNVYFGTIHSFINDFISSFFSHRAIIDLYWELYKGKISQRIDNVENKENIKESNTRYIEKYGALNLDTVYKNIASISYGEAPYTSLYRGALSHDDLITFTRIAVDRYPIIKKKIAEKYQLIFIDEYQDTSADVLHIFYSAMKGSNGELYLLGDKMQQIYKTYNGSFENEFSKFDRSKKLDINYRTTPYIVDILNSIYNDDMLKQSPFEKNSNEEMRFKPCVIFSENRDEAISEFAKNNPDALILYLTNKERFINLGAGNLFEAFNSIGKYSFAGKYSAVDVLTKEEVSETDILLNLLFFLINICNYYQEAQYGNIFRIIRKNDKLFNRKEYLINVHSDKKKIQSKMDIILKAFEDEKITIAEYLLICKDNLLIVEDYYDRLLEDSDYLQAFSVKLFEVKQLNNYLSNPNISTQHGVKGESHDTVLFVAEDSNRTPVVHMSRFFSMWSSMDVVLTELDAFYYRYMELINGIEKECEMKVTELPSANYNEILVEIEKLIQNFMNDNVDNQYYDFLLKDTMTKYIKKNNLTNAKACLKENNVYGTLSAYRLFYVGCSRARKNLAIVIQNRDIDGCRSALQEKFKSIGFDVIE